MALYIEVKNLLAHALACKAMNDDVLAIEQDRKHLLLVMDATLQRAKDYCSILLWQLCKSGFDAVGNVYRYDHCVDEYCPASLAHLPCILVTL